MSSIDRLAKLLAADPAAAEVLENKVYKATFVLNPHAWSKQDIDPVWKWASVRFEVASASSLPDAPGLYAFVLRVPFKGLPEHGWVLYLGETGDSSSKHTIKKRFRDYLREKNNRKRLDIHMMLNVWDDNLEFFYLPLPSEKHRLKHLETRLLDTLKPPFTKQGYSAQEQAPQSAF
jgi:hypothetical protein